ncbi:hypothetical protein BUALT_Bualt02G0156300 [Buddleja alternifolia]|uniref:NAC domain-containing protein n=1 Tax=Buddleja alternifolia TaxID=168488 RepID=A0AAV6Y0K1_9LAMI|nr:hypothetical protein BUALT_Bualt02G0156300 [Buddleja alternifolia]
MGVRLGNIDSHSTSMSNLKDDKDGLILKKSFLKRINSHDSISNSKLMEDGDGIHTKSLLNSHDSISNSMEGGDGILPIGYRFSPTDKELIIFYLVEKSLSSHNNVPNQVIKDIDAKEFYSKSPDMIVEDICGDQKEREWYFFIYYDKEFFRKQEKLRREDNYSEGDRIIGGKIGFWRSVGKEDPIYDDVGNICAFKIHSSYFSVFPSKKQMKTKKQTRTHWRMEEYILTNKNSDQENPTFSDATYKYPSSNLSLDRELPMDGGKNHEREKLQLVLNRTKRRSSIAWTGRRYNFITSPDHDEALAILDWRLSIWLGGKAQITLLLWSSDRDL